MKKGLSLLVCATALFGLSQLASAAATSTDTTTGTQTLDGQMANFSDNTADIEVNGTLGAENTDPTAPIPEDDNQGKPNPEWINVTVPTKTIFYNAIGNPEIKAPNYTITNNSGRPVDVSLNNFTQKNPVTALPTDFELNLNLTSASTEITAASTNLITGGKLVTTFGNELVTLANIEGKQTQKGTATPNSNIATFTYGGKATVTETQKSEYTLNLKFVPVTTEFANN